MQTKQNSTEQNQLKKRLESAEFTFLLEYQVPSNQEKLGTVYEEVNSLCEFIKTEKTISAISLTDRTSSIDALNPIDISEKLKDRSGAEPIIHLSGKGQTLSEIEDKLTAIVASGTNNILAMTGDYDPSYKEYTDGVDIILCARKKYPKMVIGATVNPFKYTVNDTYGQYLKMLRKINAGADYIVTQTGWDMKKMQELLLFCRLREIHIPMIARVTLISAADIQKFSELSLNKGVTISRSFAAQIQREFANSTQFMATQLTRLCLQIVGCIKLGYSGVQLCGLKSESELKTVMETVNKMLRHFKTFKEWSDEWKKFHHGIEMVTHPYTFYMFRNLLEFQTDYEIENEFKLSDATFTELNFNQKLKIIISKLIAVDQRSGIVGNFLRSLLTGSSEIPTHPLAKTHYAPINQCPKKLYHGACGGSKIDGSCETSEKTCIHNLRITLAADKNELDKLENPNE